MAEYLLDTDHLSYIEEEHPRVLERLSALASSDRVFTSVICVGELLRGVYLLPRGRRQRQLLERYTQVVAQMQEILPISLSVAEKFAETDAKLHRKGRPIPINDVWLAAQALMRGAVVVTNDVHFRYVDGLRTANWTR